MRVRFTWYECPIPADRMYHESMTKTFKGRPSAGDLMDWFAENMPDDLMPAQRATAMDTVQITRLPKFRNGKRVA